MKTNQELRIGLLKAVIANPHQAPTAVAALHRVVAVSDPDFYARFALWSNSNTIGQVQREIMLANLLAAESPQLRQLGATQIMTLVPTQLSTIIKLLKGEFGKIPRSTRTAVTRYLRGLESLPDQFDMTALSAGGALKHLYAGLRIKPDTRADAILFKKNPPEDSLAYKLKTLLKTEDLGEQADFVLSNQIPYKAVLSVLPSMNPVILALLIAPMTPDEVKTHLPSLKTRGALDHPAVRAIVREKQNRNSATAAQSTKPIHGELDQKLTEILATPLPVNTLGAKAG